MKKTFGLSIYALVAIAMLTGCAHHKKQVQPSFVTMFEFSSPPFRERLSSDYAASRLLRRVEAEYPDPVAALLQGDHIDPEKVIGEEDVLVGIVIDERGNVSEAKVLEGGEPAGEAALKAVRQWKYEPLVKRGRTRSGTVTIFYQVETTALVHVVQHGIRTPTVEIERRDLPVYAVQDAHRDIEPNLIHLVNPEYPAEAITAHIEGDVIVGFHIDEQGSVRQATTVGDPVLAAAALQAIQRWKYKPGFRDGMPAEITDAVVTVKFRL
jgi:TonB family protein